MTARFAPGALALLAAAALSDPARAEPPAGCDDVPHFIGMYGRWQSVAVDASPPEILAANPHWTTPQDIVGTPTAVCPGITFLVEQKADGEIVRILLTYVYDAATGRSYGVVTASDGSRLRGEIEHAGDTDRLRLLDFAGRVVWTETKTWTSADEFESEAVFDFDGVEGRVWFRTYRVDESAGAGQ